MSRNHNMTTDWVLEAINNLTDIIRLARHLVEDRQIHAAPVMQVEIHYS